MKLENQINFTDKGIADVRHSHYEFTFTNKLGQVKTKPRVDIPFKNLKNTRLKGLKLSLFRNGGIYFVLHYWFNRKSYKLTLGEYIPGLFGKKQVEDKPYKVTETHLNEKGHWIKKINQLFLQHYQKNICVKSRLKKNVSQLLKLCKKKKIKLFISTNKSRRNAKLLLKKLNILDYFLFVAGSETFKFKKPNPIHLKTLYKKFKIDKNQSIMIGDSKIDAECAKKNGTKFILVKNGYTNIHHNKIFSNFKVNGFREIIKIVKNIANKNS